MRRLTFLLGVLVLSHVLLAHQPPQQAQPAPDAGQIKARAQAALDAWRASINAPGASLGIVLKDGQSFGVVSGVSDRKLATPMRETDLLMTGSTGKTFFAALALQLIEAGRLDLEAPISRYLGRRQWFSRLPNARDVTVRMLMTHTSGLVRYETNPRFTAMLREQPDKVWTPEERVAFLLDAQPPFAAGQSWDYSDTNYIVLGMIIEEITGTKAYDEIRARFLTPLRLAHVQPTTSRRVPGLVAGYAGARDPLGLPDELMAGGQLVVNPQFEWAGGGFATSAHDLARWGHALYTAVAVSPRMRDLMIDAGVPARLGPETRYGLGVIIRPTTPVGPAWGHSGFFPGYLTELLHVPGLGATFAIQINTSATRPAGTLAPLRFLYDLAQGV